MWIWAQGLSGALWVGSALCLGCYIVCWKASGKIFVRAARIIRSWLWWLPVSASTAKATASALPVLSAASVVEKWHGH